jgi:ZIP family zinc transporter
MRSHTINVPPVEEVEEPPSGDTLGCPTTDDDPRRLSASHHFHHAEHEHPKSDKGPRQPSAHSHTHDASIEHHHHVPTNAFMSIGLQTSVAIALHKAPEGFITYATNHANPTLGFAVFMALFIHNITEGFAMSLPLYLALGSRWKAILWSSFLGGASQPLGAGVAALWFKLANRSNLGAPTEGVYGGMFAVTSGVMTSVALSLFSESLQLSHNKHICIAFAFLGMGILGLSSALTAK